MRAALAVVVGLALCSCDSPPEPLPDELQQRSPAATAAATELALGDGWVIDTSRVATNGGTEVFLCSAYRRNAMGKVLVAMYMPDDSQTTNPAVSLMFTVPADLLPQPVGRYYVIGFPAAHDLIPIDGREIQTLEGGLHTFVDAKEFRPQLTQLLVKERSVRLIQTNMDVTMERVVAEVDIPFAGAVRQALVRCEATGGAEGPTKAAYITYRR